VDAAPINHIYCSIIQRCW